MLMGTMQGRRLAQFHLGGFRVLVCSFASHGSFHFDGMPGEGLNGLKYFLFKLNFWHRFACY
jgi:hypothetical protein